MNPLLHAYAGVPPAQRLSDWLRSEVYRPLPDDWLVFAADVQGSAQAIAQGNYKQVNALGTACIVAATNACGEDAIPFSFGGDGAVLAVPAQFDAAISAAWAGLRASAQAATGLKLRIGRIPVRALRERGADLLVARQVMPGGFELALFRGGGVSLADQLIKTEPQAWAIEDSMAGADALSVEGLECRWNDVPARHGRILTLVVRVQGPDLSVLQPLLDYLEQILPHANPVRVDSLPTSWPPRHLGLELALRVRRRLQRALRHLGVWLLTGLFAGLVRRQMLNPLSQAGAYVRSLAANTDHIKLDDLLRAVVDVTPAQAGAIEALLQHLQAQGHVRYGLHLSDHALMTCFVRSLDRHVHFVDGGDGGYAVAAAALKRPRAAPAPASAAGPGPGRPPG